MRFLLSFTTAFALVSTVACASVSGPFLGGQLGANYLAGTHKYTNGAGGEAEQKAKAFGFTGGVSAGYVHLSQSSKIVWGAEVFGHMNAASSKKDLQVKDGPKEGNVTLKSKMFFGGAVLVGVALNPKVATYARVGYEMHRFSCEYSNLTYQTPTTEKYTKSTRGIAPGAGVFYKLTPSLVIGAEYVMTLLGKMTLRSDAAAINGVKRGYTFAPHCHRLMARLLYVF